MDNEALIESLVTIGNHEVVVKACEPHIVEPQKLRAWMVARTLQALALFQEEMDKDAQR